MDSRVKQVVFAVALLVIAGGLGYAFLSSNHGVDAPQSSAAPSAAPRVPPPAMPPTPPHAHAAPLEAFATAQVGDWYAYRATSTGAMGETRATAMVAITAVTADAVTRSLRGRVEATGPDGKPAEPPDEKPEPSDAFPRAGLTLERLTGADIGDWTLSDVTIVDEPHTVGGRAFACKKVSYASADPLFPDKRTHTDLWISAEVPAGGLVEQHEVQHLGDMTFEMTMQLTGFGSGATTWGTRPTGW